MPMYLNFVLAVIVGFSTYFLSSKITYVLWFLLVIAVYASYNHHTTSSLNLSF